MYVNRPETYDRPFEVHPVQVSDARGSKSKYTLDGSGFPFYEYTANEKDFLDEEKIKRGYYVGIEQLLNIHR